MYDRNTFASPSLQQFNTPFKERLVGQQELIRLIGRLKTAIMKRKEQREREGAKGASGGLEGLAGQTDGSPLKFTVP